MSVKQNRYAVIIEQELARVDLNMSDDLFIIPTTRLSQLIDGITMRIIQQAAHDMTDGDQAWHPNKPTPYARRSGCQARQPRNGRTFASRSAR